MSAVYLNTPGIVGPLGCDVDSTVNALFAGSRHGLQLRDDLMPGRALRCGVVNTPLPAIPPSLSVYACRNNQLLLAALAQIQHQVDAVIDRYGAQRVAVILGSSTSGIAEGSAAIREKQCSGQWPSSFNYLQQEIGTPALFLAHYLGLQGIAYTVSTACTSSTKAFVSARNILRANLADAVIVGGADSLCDLTVTGFAALESVSQGMCQPFAATRDGINIGEGAALFVMTKEPAPVRLSGVGESSDAYHISAPHPDGIGAQAALRAALQDAQLDAGDIAYLNLHGTATRKNDEMEARAVHALWGDSLPCSSTKALTGHLLGAAGATELAYCWFTLMRGDDALPPHVIDTAIDTDLPALHLLGPGEKAQQSVRHVMSANYAFGGSNAALILSRV